MRTFAGFADPFGFGRDDFLRGAGGYVEFPASTSATKRAPPIDMAFVVFTDPSCS
jgi:hypothetical protein